LPEGAEAVAHAVRATKPPMLDGRGDDAVWLSAPITRGFRQFYPQEDGQPSVETEFRVAYDDRNLYVLVHALDPHPDSIRHAITRRDVSSASDYVGITIDGFYDHRTGYEFVINRGMACGTRRRGSILLGGRRNSVFHFLSFAIATFAITHSALRCGETATASRSRRSGRCGASVAAG
jgi:hypothetical protein